MTDITLILKRAEQGDAVAAAELLPLVYEELRLLAKQRIAQEKPGHTLDATALVHEAYLRLVRPSTDEAPLAPQRTFSDRRHFYCVAARTMRRILVDRARAKNAQKRGGEFQRLAPELADFAIAEPREDVIALDEGLERLAGEDPEAAELVHLHYFAGFSLVDAAEILGVSPRTAHRLWAYAKAFLFKHLQKE